MRPFFSLILFFIEIGCLPFLALLAIVSRYVKRPIDVGLGPEPLINNIAHQQALRKQGYSSETFVSHVYYTTQNFDVRADRLFKSHLLRHLYLYMYALFRYKALYIYFNGGPLGFLRSLARVEPWFYRLAGIKVVAMPYGSDVQDLSRCPNLAFKHVMSLQYPADCRRVAARIDRWTRYADHIIAGCDWVDYLSHWDTLLSGHFSIDTQKWRPQPRKEVSRPFRILHAPNHRLLKGSQFFIDAVQELQQEGHDIELVLLERVPNEQIREAIASVDLVADQLIIGWYALFAIEAMAMAKPVLCYLREDLLQFYHDTSVLRRDEIPLINCNPRTVLETLRHLLQHPEQLAASALQGPLFVQRHHSLEAIGKIFNTINEKLSISCPSQRDAQSWQNLGCLNLSNQPQ